MELSCCCWFWHQWRFGLASKPRRDKALQIRPRILNHLWSQWWMSNTLQTHDKAQERWMCEEGRCLLHCEAIPVKALLVWLWQHRRKQVISWVPRTRHWHAFPCFVGCEQSPDHPTLLFLYTGRLHSHAGWERLGVGLWAREDFCKLLRLPLAWVPVENCLPYSGKIMFSCKDFSPGFCPLDHFLTGR